MFQSHPLMTCEGRYPGVHLQTLAGLSLDPGLRRGERLKSVCFQLNPLMTCEGRYPRGSAATDCRPVPGPRPTPGGAAERCVFSISSAHTCEGRYPGDPLQTLAGLSLDPGLRRGERCLGGTSIPSAHDLRRPVSRGSSQPSAGLSLGLEERFGCDCSIPLQI